MTGSKKSQPPYEGSKNQNVRRGGKNETPQPPTESRGCTVNLGGDGAGQMQSVEARGFPQRGSTRRTRALGEG